MGGRESKQVTLSYDEAVKRVSDSELARLKDAYKRTATVGGAIGKQAFVREILGDGVPMPLAEVIFECCGGTARGISFKDLLCALVLLTKGTEDEKIKFIFGLYASEGGTYVTRSEMYRQVQATEGVYTVAVLNNCFRKCERVPYEDFRDWLLMNRDATTVTRWLLADRCHVSLSNDLETPTFYQTLAGVTHLEETDIIELEKRYWNLKGFSPTGKLDSETLVPLMSPPLPHSLAVGIFNAFDENRDNHIDFKEMACGISASCRGPALERQKFCFRIFDSDRDGRLSHDELTAMARTLLLVGGDVGEEIEGEAWLRKVEALVEDVKQAHDPTDSGFVTQEEFLIWTLNNPLATAFLEVIFQLCHVILGLKPLTRGEEGGIVKGWLRRAEAKPLVVGHHWYIVAMEWWNSWLEYVNSAQVGTENGLSTSHSGSPSCSQNGSLKRTKLQKKSAMADGALAMDNSGITAMSVTNIISADSISLSSLESDISVSATSPSSSGHVHNGSSVPAGQRNGSMSSSCSSPRKNYNSGSLCVFASHENGRGLTPSPSPSPRLGRKATNGLNGLGPFGPPAKPSAIDNSPLVEPPLPKVTVLTWEGGRLKRTIPLVQGRDFVLVPESLWRALLQWYGGTPPLPRQVIQNHTTGIVELELYPVTLRILRHSQPPSRPAGNPGGGWGGVVGGYGTAALNAAPYYMPTSLANTLTAPKRYLAYLAAFSRLAQVRQVADYLAAKLRLRTEDMRLWVLKSESSDMALLEDETATLEEAGVIDFTQVLLEVRNKDLSWPEEINQIACRGSRINGLPGSSEKGVTGLNNLGNTCFLNAALQCCSNTLPLTKYFLLNMHLYELNPSNPCSTKGQVARQYAQLMHEIWAGGARTVAPLKLRWTIGKYSGNFTGFQQHDSQELLAFLLDGLHEDLNRVHDKPYAELKDSDGRPDTIVAQEAWENHILRNKSIIVDLFHGQLKSKVTCKVCGNESARFDPFSYLTLQMPMENYVYFEVIVLLLDGSVPYKYGIRLNSESHYRDVKQTVHALTSIPTQQLLLCELANSQIKLIPGDEVRIRAMITGSALFVYELPPHPTSVLTTGNVVSSSPTSRERRVLSQIQRSTSHSPAGERKDNDLNRLHSTGSSSSDESRLSVGSSAQRSNSESSQSSDQFNESVATSVHIEDTQKETDMSLSSGAFSGSSPNSNSSLSPPITGSFVGSSPSSTGSVVHLGNLHSTLKGFMIVFHRKTMRQEVYFLSSQKTRPSLFGLPLIVPCNAMTSHQDLYQNVWTQVSRLVSPLPPAESTGLNHAYDCDDSLGYEFPFVLRAVDRDGLHCAWCPWYRFCRGCQIPCDSDRFMQSSAFAAIDWDPTALHLRYQTSLEKEFLDHPSVEELRRKHIEPIALADCLEAFCAEETLDYSCDKCKKVQRAAKKLQIWQLPPILIVHLKRFQLVGNRWVKSQKIVDFPLSHFDPTEYLASVPKQTILLHRAEMEGTEPGEYLAALGEEGGESAFLQVVPEEGVTILAPVKDSLNCVGIDAVSCITSNASRSEDIMSCKSDVHLRSSVPANGATHGTYQRRVRNGSVLYGDTLQDFHQHRLKDGYDPLDLRYNLYAIACHTGVMEGGHYVCYAKNPQGKWICFNDSSCKEVSEAQVDLNSAYMLFYQREGLSVDKYMPVVEGKTPCQGAEATEESGTDDDKRNCRLM